MKKYFALVFFLVFTNIINSQVGTYKLCHCNFLKRFLLGTYYQETLTLNKDLSYKMESENYIQEGKWQVEKDSISFFCTKSFKIDSISIQGKVYGKNTECSKAYKNSYSEKAIYAVGEYCETKKKFKICYIRQ